MRGIRGFCTGFPGYASSSFQRLKGRSFDGAAGRPKWAAKVLHFRRKCCISVFGAPDQREKGPNGGEKCYEKMHQWKCNTFGQKSAEIETPREHVFELILAGKTARKCDCSRPAMHSFCTGFVQLLEIVQIWTGKDRPKPGCYRRYMKVRPKNVMHATGADAGIARRRVWGMTAGGPVGEEFPTLSVRIGVSAALQVQSTAPLSMVLCRRKPCWRAVWTDYPLKLKLFLMSSNRQEGSYRITLSGFSVSRWGFGLSFCSMRFCRLCFFCVSIRGICAPTGYGRSS